MKINIKRLSQEAVIPKYSKEGDAGLDITAIAQHFKYRNQIEYDTGIALEVPEGYVGLIYPRSSIFKYDLTLSNSVGVIDSNYRGEIKFIFNLTKNLMSAKIYKIGDRIGQIIIVPYPKIELIEVDELSKTNRGENGFGSSGK